MAMLGFQAVAAAIAETQSAHIFGLLGDGNLTLVTHLTETSPVEFVRCRHEAGAMTMASGYHRATGRTAIATVTQGPGVTNTLTALTAAVRDRSPVVLVVGDIDPATGYHTQRSDHRALAAAAGAGFVESLDPAGLRADAGAVFAAAERDQRPYLWNIPEQVLGAEVLGDASVVPGAVVPPTAPGTPDPDAVTRIAALLAAADRPVILAGLGAVKAGAGEALRALGDVTGALMATTLMAHGLFADDPWSTGVAGGFSSPASAELLAEADLVVSFGARLNPLTLARGRLFGAATVVQVDRDRAAFDDAAQRAPVGLVADAAEAATAILTALDGNRDRSPRGYRDPAAGVRPAELRPDLAAGHPHGGPAPGEPGRIDPAVFAVALDRILPRERTIVVDTGHFMQFACTHLTPVDQRGFQLAVGFGSLGLSLGTAIGAAVGRPDRLTVVAVGDGGLLMSLSELETVARLGLRMVVAVFNDAAYGAEVHHLRAKGWPDEVARFPPVDLAAVATSLGIASRVVTSVADVTALTGADLAGPLLLDARIDRTVVAPYFAAKYPGGAPVVVPA